MNARWTKLFRNLNRAPEILRCSRACKQWGSLALGYLGLRSPNYPLRVDFRDGGQIRLDTFFDLTTFWTVFFAHTYPVSSSEAVILDAGANIGTFTLYAARSAPSARILAFEPFAPTFRRLTETVSTNRLSSRIVCIQCALGDHEGEVCMADGDQPSQFRRIVPGDGAVSRITTLESAFQEHALESVDLLKMDIEGGEFPALLGSSPSLLRRIRRICLEYHPTFADQPQSKDQLFDHLVRAGFECTFHRSDGEGYGIAHFQNTEKSADA